MARRVVFTSQVQNAINGFLDYVPEHNLYDALNFIEKLQKSLTDTLLTFPKGCPIFQGKTRYFTIDGYTFLYEYDDEKDIIIVLDMYSPGQNWR